jgi:tetratricopeptide (TPR) repeat protein
VTDKIEGERLLGKLDGLPLAIAQAGAYLQESGVGVRTYTKFYEQQWKDLMSSEGETEAPLQDYPDRSIWTTWVISYNALKEKHENAANLLFLWSFLDNKDLWYELFATACQKSTTTRSNLSNWIGTAASSELDFSQAMRVLRSYSLVEEAEAAASYSTHPVVHKWAYYYQSQDSRKRIGRLAVMAIGWAVPSRSTRDYSAVQRRLLPHVQACSRYVVMAEPDQIDKSRDENESESEERENNIAYLDGIHLLGILYAEQGKLGDTEKMYMRALQGYEETFRPKHTSTLRMVNSLGNLYADQGKLDNAEKMYMRALQGYEEALGLKHISTLSIVNNLGLLYVGQGKLNDAKKMYMRALEGKEEALGLKHISTLHTVNNLGNLYAGQGKLNDAEKMYMQALQGYEEALDSNTVARYRPALNTLWGLGYVFAAKGEKTKAKVMYTRSLNGFEVLLGSSCNEYRDLTQYIASLEG